MPFLIIPKTIEEQSNLTNKYQNFIPSILPFGRIVDCTIFNQWRRTHYDRTHPTIPIPIVDFKNDFHVVTFYKADIQDLIDKALPTQFIGAFLGCSFTTGGGGRFNKTTLFMGITEKIVTSGLPDKFEFVAGQPVYEGNATTSGNSLSATQAGRILIKSSRDFYVAMVQELQKIRNSGFSRNKEMTGIHHELADFRDNFFYDILQTNPRTGKIKAIFMKDIDPTCDRTTIVYADESQQFDPAVDLVCPATTDPQPILFDFGTGCCQI